MNREDIIRMARESEWLSKYDSSTGFSAEVAIRFAELVAAHEREECAKVCEEKYEFYGYDHVFAAAIRARGQK